MTGNLAGDLDRTWQNFSKVSKASDLEILHYRQPRSSAGKTNRNNNDYLYHQATLAELPRHSSNPLEIHSNPVNTVRIPREWSCHDHGLEHSIDGNVCFGRQK